MAMTNLDGKWQYRNCFNWINIKNYADAGIHMAANHLPTTLLNAKLLRIKTDQSAFSNVIFCDVTVHHVLNSQGYFITSTNCSRDKYDMLLKIT